MRVPRFDEGRLARFGDRLAADVEAGAIPGADVLIGGRDGVLWRRCVGFRNVALRDPLRENAVWRIFSMTKVLVSAAALVLAERGLLRLDQPVADFIPALADLYVLHADGTREPAAAAPTVQDLLRHTAGFAYAYLGDSPAQRALAADGFFREDLDNRAFAERLAALPLEYRPGSTWHYSHATDVLGRVLEVAAGAADLQGVLDDALLHPLGMQETVFVLPRAEAARVAEPLPQAPGQRPLFGDPCLPQRGQRGNGGLVSTTADYARFLRAMLREGLHGGGRLLAPASVRLMTADHLGALERGAYYPPGPGYGFGLGVAVRLVLGEAPFPGSVGDWWWSGVGGTYFWVDPMESFFAIVLMQTSSAEQRQHYRTLARTMIYAASAT